MESSFSSHTRHRRRIPRDPPSITTAVELVARIVAPTTILLALLYYIGWVRTDAIYRSFGIHESMLKFSVQEYLMRGVQAAYRFLRDLLLISLFAYIGHWILQRGLLKVSSSIRDRLGPLIIRLIGIVGIALFILSFSRLQLHVPALQCNWFPPLAFTSGVALAAYAFHLYTLASSTQGAPSTIRMTDALRRTTLAIAFILITLGVFWCASTYADEKGQERAQAIFSQPSQLTAVVLYSQDSLVINVPGIQETKLTAPDAFYRYTYTGLRFLIRSAGKYFLVSHLWPSQTTQVIVILDNDQIRLETTLH